MATIPSSSCNVAGSLSSEGTGPGGRAAVRASPARSTDGVPASQDSRRRQASGVPGSSQCRHDCDNRSIGGPRLGSPRSSRDSSNLRARDPGPFNYPIEVFAEWRGGLLRECSIPRSDRKVEGAKVWRRGGDGALRAGSIETSGSPSRCALWWTTFAYSRVRWPGSRKLAQQSGERRLAVRQGFEF